MVMGNNYFRINSVYILYYRPKFTLDMCYRSIPLRRINKVNSSVPIKPR